MQRGWTKLTWFLVYAEFLILLVPSIYAIGLVWLRVSVL